MNRRALLLGGTAVAAAIGPPRRADACQTELGMLDAALVVGDWHIGAVAGGGAIVIANRTTAETAALNLPRPPAAQMSWIEQPAPPVPFGSKRQQQVDVVFDAERDAVTALVAFGSVAYFAVTERFGPAYLVRFDPYGSAFSTRSLEFGGAVKALFVSRGKLAVVTPSDEIVRVDVP